MKTGRYYLISSSVVPGTPKGGAVRGFVQFMAGEYAQNTWLEKLKLLPSNANVAKSPIILRDAILAGSAAHLEKGWSMPAAPQLRCFWDAARDGLKGILADEVTPD